MIQARSFLLSKTASGYYSRQSARGTPVEKS